MKPGTQLGPYEIVGMLGAGGMGEVYRARDSRLGREVAIKILPAEFAKDADLKARFEREARTISSISDPHICALYDVGEVAATDSGETIPYLVMEYLRGESLASRVGRGPLPMAQVFTYGAEIARALASAHRLGIIHRDLKPGNVMITPTGAKLLDFGLAKSTVRHSSDGETPTAPITGSGAVVGTLHYMSPEQLEGRDADGRTDIFALGVVLYEMAAGRRAFTGASPASLASAILRDEPGPLRQLNPLIPRAFERLVRRCLAKDPDQRWQSAADVAAELRELGAELESGRVEVEVSAQTEESHRSRRMLVRAGLLAIFVAAVAGVLWIMARVKPISPNLPVRVSVVPLTSQPGIEWFPSLSPDGKWVVYSGIADVHRHIFLQSVGGQKPVDLTEDSTDDDDQPAFSPDGERIAFTSSRDGGGIFVMGRTGEGSRRLTHQGFRPTWSPDGKTIAYTTGNLDPLNPGSKSGNSELWSVAADGGEPKLLRAEDAILASWSPGGHRIAFVARTGDPFHVDIWTVSATGTDPVQVTDDKAIDSSPAWSPDGRFIYFTSDRDGSMNLWRITVDEATGAPHGGSEPVSVPSERVALPSFSVDGTKIAYVSAQQAINIQRLAIDMKTLMPIGDPEWVTTGSRHWSSPDPSPDGESVAFYSLTQPAGNVYVARRDGSGLRLLTGDNADNVPRWSSTGDWIAFFSKRGGTFDVWRIHPDGSSLQKVSEGGGIIPVWSPDATRIAAPQGIDKNTVVFDPDSPWSEQEPEVLPDLEKEGRHFWVNSWSPDGENLVGSFGVGAEAKGVVVFNLETRSHELLTDFGEWPVWLPDSRRILFVAAGKAFYVVDAKTKKVERIYSVTTDVIGPPRISSKGEIFYSRRVTEADLWLATLQ